VALGAGRARVIRSCSARLTLTALGLHWVPALRAAVPLVKMAPIAVRQPDRSRWFRSPCDRDRRGAPPWSRPPRHAWIRWACCGRVRPFRC
jgi:hypothetical protein